MLEINMINGKSLMIKLGINIIVKNKGLNILVSRFLKKFNFFKRFRIIPKQKKTTETTIKRVFKKFFNM